MKPTLQIVDVIATPGHTAAGFLGVPSPNVRRPLALINGVNEGATWQASSGAARDGPPTVGPAVQRGKGPELVAGEDNTWTRRLVAGHAPVALFCFVCLRKGCTIHMVLCKSLRWRSTAETRAIAARHTCSTVSSRSTQPAGKRCQEAHHMHDLLRVGIIGDFDPHLRSHIATNEAIRHAASALSVTVECAWLPTPSLDAEDNETTLQPCDALWCAPASPYKSMQGALRAIRFAREKGWPFLGT